MFEREQGHDPNRSLWQEVLLRAVDDALLGLDTSAGKVASRIRECYEARRFLTTPSRDLTIVCTLAGFDPAAVIDRMTARIAAAPSPEDLAAERRAMRSTQNKRPIKRPAA